MGSEQRSVITAIRDMDREGSIAAALSRLGWRVTYRATDLGSLSKYVSENPDFVIVASDDFRGIDKLGARNRIILRGLSQPLVAGAVESPTSDSELHHLMSSISQGTVEKFISYPKIETAVYTVASLGRNVGATTIALNFAAELAAQGKSLLLIDCHTAHPSISSYLSLHGLREKIIETEFGFSATEAVGIEKISELTTLASNFDAVVIDLGELLVSERTTVGSRVNDVLTTWALKSSVRLHIVSDLRAPVNDELRRRLVSLSKVAEISYIDRVIQLSEITNKRDIHLHKKSSEEELGIPSFIYPYDRRTIQAIRRDQRPLAQIAAKSVLRGEIQKHLQACEKRVQFKAR